VTPPLLRLGIDLGGTKTEIVALGRAGEGLYRRRVSTPRDYRGTLSCIAGLVAEAERALAGHGTVGVGIPGTVSAGTGLVKNANSTWLIGQPLDRDLAEVLQRPVRVMNDANCFALSEASDGAGAGAASVFGVILGTGVGGGIVLDGKVVAGANLVAGEWGHIPLPAPRDDERPGPQCYCGHRGCVETWLSGPGLAADHARMTGEELTAAEIGRRAGEGEPVAAATLERYVERLGRALAVVVNIVDPEVVVLGGGVSNLPGLPERVARTLPAHVFSDQVTTRVVRHEHGDSSGVRGAAWLWTEAEARAVTGG
jgi:fructokinase